MSVDSMNREQYSEKEWLVDLFTPSESSRTVIVAKTSLKIFDIFCKHQGVSREQIIKKYQKWFKPDKIDGERPDPDVRSICISLSKFTQFMNEDHEDVVTSVNTKPGKESTFKKKSPKTIKLYFGFVKSYLRKCHEIKVSIEDIKDYVIFPKKRKITRQPISLEQLKQIMNEANPKRRALYYVLVSSGMRLGEALTLTKRNFHFEETPVRIEIEAENTKTKEDRSTYISSEAVEKMKRVLGEIYQHKPECDCMECSKQIFAWIEPHQPECDCKKCSRGITMSDVQTINVAYEDQYFGHLRTRLGIKLGQKQSNANFDGEGFFKRYSNSVRYVVNLHSLRAYFITKASQKHGSDYGHALSGHGSYLKQYIRIPAEEQARLYTELEPDLLIESVPVESNKTKDKIITSLQDQMIEMQEEMKRMKKTPDSYEITA